MECELLFSVCRDTVEIQLKYNQKKESNVGEGDELKGEVGLTSRHLPLKNRCLLLHLELEIGKLICCWL